MQSIHLPYILMSFARGFYLWWMKFIPLPIYMSSWAHLSRGTWAHEQIISGEPSSMCKVMESIVRGEMLKSGFKYSTYSVVMHILYNQDTKSASLPMVSFSFMAKKQNVKMKPQPTKQQPQNPEALQEYFLSHKISQSLI